MIIKKVYNQFRRWRLYYESRDTLSKNIKLKNQHKGKRCFILGTGPSIKDQDLLKLKNEYTFASNNFWKHPQFKEINPNYYVTIDTLAFRRGDKMNYWGKQSIANAHKINDVPMTSFFHIKTKEVIEKEKLFSSHNRHYLAFDGFFRENLKFNTDISKVMPYAKNVVLVCILIAIHSGFEEIYLLGCEHDFLAYPTNFEATKHFYKDEGFDAKNPEDVKTYGLCMHSYEHAISSANMLFRNYRLLKAKMAKESPNIKIYNATPNSFLDVFPVINFEDIKFDE